MNIQYVREFIALSETMNITATAKKLYISQPALSNHIASLEKDVGVPLITHGYPAALTDAGRDLVARGQMLVDLHDEVVEACREAAAKFNSLRIYFDTLMISNMKDNTDLFISEFLMQYPHVRIHQVDWNGSSLHDSLESGELDCAFANYAMIPEDVDAGVRYELVPNFTKGRYCLWMDKRHPLA